MVIRELVNVLEKNSVSCKKGGKSMTCMFGLGPPILPVVGRSWGAKAIGVSTPAGGFSAALVLASSSSHLRCNHVAWISWSSWSIR